MHDSENLVFDLAADFINHTSRSVFLTGKAGTGKTTFLRHIAKTTHKHFAIAAPTGVAAINAGGMTLHSLFQLPFGIYLPGAHVQHASIQITSRSTLFKNLHLTKSKREVLQELELLIIDEVSMVRCDTLDAVDTILKGVRRSPLPFGGVQVLLIGDLFQLSPVAKNEEWNILKHQYESPFFFHAKVMQEAAPLPIELNKIYRQSEQNFIDLLNNIRNNTVTEKDLNFLNARLLKNEKPEGAITLTTHNHKADAINEEQLKNLPGKIYTFRAEVVNDFPDRNFPTDDVLTIKKGARIMFIKNDTSEEKRYYNGKIATVVDVDHELIVAEFDDGSSFELTKEVWRNIRYQYNADADEIDEDELGSFTQYPIRLAWAITIHKSQGLTFQQAIIDAGDSFAAGQVYVALSRCTSLAGLHLQSLISPKQIMTDSQVVAYSQQVKSASELHQLLPSEKDVFVKRQFARVFTFIKLQNSISAWAAGVGEQKKKDQQAILLSGKLMGKAMQLEELADKTRAWLERNSNSSDQHEKTISFEDGLRKSINHFYELLHKDFYLPLYEYTKSIQLKSKTKKQSRELQELLKVINGLAQKLCTVIWDDEILFTGKENYFKTLEPTITQAATSTVEESKILFEQGLSLDAIAETRGITLSTVEGHISLLVKQGELPIEKFVNEPKTSIILKAFNELDTTSLTTVKEKLGDDYTYGEIRMVFNHGEYLKSQKLHQGK